MQARYNTHRTTRNSQQKLKMLDRKFPGPIIDPILLRLSDPTVEPGYVDPRHCFVFWGRPSAKIKNLINRVQQDLFTVAPSKCLLCSNDISIEENHSPSIVPSVAFTWLSSHCVPYIKTPLSRAASRSTKEGDAKETRCFPNFLKS